MMTKREIREWVEAAKAAAEVESEDGYGDATKIAYLRGVADALAILFLNDVPKHELPDHLYDICPDSYRQ